MMMPLLSCFIRAGLKPEGTLWASGQFELENSVKVMVRGWGRGGHVMCLGPACEMWGTPSRIASAVGIFLSAGSPWLGWVGQSIIVRVT